MKPIRDPEGVETAALLQAGVIDGRNVIEIGCGDGRLTWRYAPFAAAAAGVDPHSDRLAGIAGTRPADLRTPVLFAQAAAERLPFAAEAFSCALYAWSL